MKNHIVNALILFCSIFILSATNHIMANDCEIENVETTLMDCDNEGFFMVKLDFDYANTGNEGFRVQGNGIDHGDFEYSDLPVLIGPLQGDGETEHEFVVIDKQYEECSNWTAIDPVDCEGGNEECYISELTIDDHPCEDGLYSVYLNFEYEHVSDEGFKLLIDNEYFDTYSYADLPLNIGYFIGDGTTTYHFLVRDLGFEGCASDANYGPVYCDSTGNCNIWDVEADILPCNESGFFKVALDFEYVNVGNAGFRVQGNGTNHGDFEYSDLPILIGPLEGDGETVYEFVVIDNQYEECSDWAAIDPVDCGQTDCNIWDLVVDENPCEDGEFSVYLDFEYENVCESGFKLFLNWELYESYSYEDLPVLVGPLDGDGETSYHFLVRDKQFEACAEDIAIDPVDCNELACSILDVEAVALPCNDNNEFDVLLDFEYENVGNEGFEVNGNGNNYGTFDYEDLPLILGPFLADGITEYEFEARDKEYNECYDWTSIDPFNCDSTVQITNMDMTIEDCETNSYYLLIDFDHDADANESFMIFGNGTVSQTFNYGDLPVQIGPLTNDEVTAYYFVVMNDGTGNAGNWKQLFPFTCESLGEAEVLTLKEYTIIYPNPSNGLVNFKYSGKEKMEVRIYDLTGNIIRRFIMLGESIGQVTISEPGLYFYRINDSNTSTSGKFTIR